MRFIRRVVLAIVLSGTVALTLVVWSRIARVTRAAAAIPVYPGAREGGKRVRYWHHVLSWDDRSSARVDRPFVLRTTSLLAIARQAQDALVAQGWYLVTPDDLRQVAIDPQVIVWQRGPDERLDLARPVLRCKGGPLFAHQHRRRAKEVSDSPIGHARLRPGVIEADCGAVCLSGAMPDAPGRSCPTP